MKQNCKLLLIGTQNFLIDPNYTLTLESPILGFKKKYVPKLLVGFSVVQLCVFTVSRVRQIAADN